MSYIKVGQLVIVRPSSDLRRRWYESYLERIGIVLETYEDNQSALVSLSEKDEVKILQEDLAVFIEDLLRGREK